MSDNIDDVRNGILMDPKFHRYFDQFFFTIFRNDDTFTIKVGEFSYPDDAELANLDGHSLSFGKNRELWPHAN